MRTTDSALRQLIRETLLTEEIFGKMAFVYHGTNSPPKQFISLLEKDEFMPGKGAGASYGKGLYTVYELAGTQTSNGSYGDYIYKLAVNFDGFISFDPDVTARAYGSPITPAEQAETLNLPREIVKKLEEFHVGESPEHSSEEAYRASRVLEGVVKGIIFKGGKDGKVAVIYDASIVTPVSYRKVDETSWTRIDREKLRPFVGRISEPLETEKYTQNKVMMVSRVKSLLKRHEMMGEIPPAERVLNGTADLTSLNLLELPIDGLHVKGNFIPSYEMKSLPRDLKVDGGMDISDSEITSIPLGLRVGKDLTLSRAVDSVESGFTVGGDLNAVGVEIEEIPSGTTVGGNADFTDSFVRKLPDDFTVGGDIKLRFSRVNQLPRGLKVGGTLDLRGTNVYQLPSDLEVGDRIYMDELDRSTIPAHMKGAADKKGTKKIWVRS